MGKASGILGVNCVVILTPRIEEGERHYADLFDAEVAFRVTIQRGTPATIDSAHGWDELKRLGLHVDTSFLRAGEVTIVLRDESPSGKTAPLGHVGLGTSDSAFRRLKERVRAAGLRFLEDTQDRFRFADQLGVTWQVTKGMELTRPGTRLDLRSGRIT